MLWMDAPTTKTAVLSDVHPYVAQVLARRGITSPSSANAFLDPDQYSPCPAADLPGIEGAVECISRAIQQKVPICIWGDFDVDGQTSTTVLLEALRAQGCTPEFYLPVRSRESHGVHITPLKGLIEHGVRLLITCDTGISSHEALDYARSQGVDVVVTDHHLLPFQLPRATAIVDPQMLPSNHPLSTLSGVGVAYKLAEALGRDHPAVAAVLPRLLDLVALGLVADLAELTGDSRYLVQKGLRELRTNRRPGLQAMLQLAELEPGHLTEEHIAFTLAPRLNALGRLGDASRAIDLFTTQDPSRARMLAIQLENHNIQRRLLTDQVTQAAEAQLRDDPALLQVPVIVLSNPRWPGGVIGIAAARLVEHYRKPVILFSTPPGEAARGSARSIPGLHITNAIAAEQDLLQGFGGHPMAAGLTLEADNLPAFSRRLQKKVADLLSAISTVESTLEIDAWLDLPDLNLELAAVLEPLSPFGPGNPKPVFASRALLVQKAELVGRNKEHCRLEVADQAGNTQPILWWNGGSGELPSGPFDLAYGVRASDWNGTDRLQVELIAFRTVETKPVNLGRKAVLVVDYRQARDLLAELQALPAGTQIWAEGEAKDSLHGTDRNALNPAPALAVWTIPPSPEEFRRALEKVQPATVYLFAAHPGKETVDDFLTRLTGLLKYAIGERNGLATYAELAAATAQRRLTVERGLNWLIMRGNLALIHQENDTLWVKPGVTMNDLGGAARLYVEIQELLAETAAYRSHFLQADKDSLLP
jgi:single-stranded-DNA-specific exonuclease